ncbi:MAG: N-acetylglucosamine kinase [Chloroflexota bacterium]
MSPLLLGVDGGATKTVALIADEAGNVLGAGRAGSSDIHSEVEPGQAVARVAAAVHEAARGAGVDPAELGSCVFSLCGADWPEDVDFYAAALSERLALRKTPTVMNDAFGALRAGTRDGVGAALVLGTGAAIAARGPAGSAWFSGERMEPSGAMEFGRRAYELLIRGEYGPGPVPGFLDTALKAFEVSSVEALVHLIMKRGGSGRRSLTRLAPILLEAGHGGDPQARPIITEHGVLLAGYLRAAARRVSLGEQGSTVVIAGGVFRHDCTDLIETVTEGLAGFRLKHSAAEPVYGVVLAAGDEQGDRPSLERLTETGPGQPFFHTL